MRKKCETGCKCGRHRGWTEERKQKHSLFVKANPQILEKLELGRVSRPRPDMAGNTYGSGNRGKPRPYMLGTKYAAGHSHGRPAKYARGFQVHLDAFKNMWARNRDYGIEVAQEFDQTTEGFAAFVDYIGPVPEGMLSPSVGRENHSQGYVRGNFKWESWDENRKEALARLHEKRKTLMKLGEYFLWLWTSST